MTPTNSKTETALRWTVDSIEEGIASVFDEQERRAGLPLWMLPPSVKEGDVLSVVARPRGDGQSVAVRVTVDRAATDEALRRSREQLRRTPQTNDPGGPITL